MAYTKPVCTDFTPGNGQTISIPAFDDSVMCVFIRPATLLAALTIAFPTGCQNGQAIRAFFSNVVTVLSCTYPGGVGVIGGATTALATKSIVASYNAATDQWFMG